MTKKFLILAALTIVFVCSGVCSTFIVYNDRTAWENAMNAAGLGPWTTVAFDGPLAPSIKVAQSPSGDTHGDVNSGAWADSLTESQSTTWTFAFLPMPTTNLEMNGWGATFNLEAGPGLNVSILERGTALTSANIGTPAIAGGTNTFWGAITLDGQFDQVTITGAGPGAQAYTMDDMVYNPEPSAYTLLGIGLMGMAYLGRKARKSK